MRQKIGKHHQGTMELQQIWEPFSTTRSYSPGLAYIQILPNLAHSQLTNLRFKLIVYCKPSYLLFFWKLTWFSYGFKYRKCCGTILVKFGNVTHRTITSKWINTSELSLVSPSSIVVPSSSFMRVYHCASLSGGDSTPSCTPSSLSTLSAKLWTPSLDLAGEGLGVF